ncbi:response regulator [Vallitalea pronyensis]|uniref:Stage 0 sporulation protein A homolog n=1 Tax=Vallitalea pronyensis TaxID=1348613 RepID=A0A8J8MML4_9FIRM|nr:response regulator [Vallitalea pronyensis]QUI24279.1 response regulator [Vallitalea pronyensis]
MTILIVDDDIYVIQSIQLKMHWDALGIDEVYVAHNARQARRLLEKKPIDIIICDIEMPQETGLDLIQWVREKGYAVQTIFLTSYADFTYAKKALELDSLDYFLKPIAYDELHKGIQKAVERVNKAKEQLKHQEQSNLWVVNQDKIMENFWQNLVIDPDHISERELQLSLQKYHINYTLEDRFIPILLNLFDPHKELEKWSKNLFKFTLNNVTKDIYGVNGYGIVSMTLVDDSSWLIILKIEKLDHDDYTLKQLSNAYLQHINDIFKVELLCEIGLASTLLTIGQVIKELQVISTHHVIMQNKVILLSEYTHTNFKYNTPAMGVWESLLSKHKMDVLLRNVDMYLNSLASKDALNQDILKAFRLDFTQLIYSFLKQREISAHKLFADQKSEQHYRDAIKSLEDMMHYVKLLIDCSVEYIHYAQQTDSIVDQLKAYMDKNFEKDITRNHLTDIVYLNADYISRLFKKEVGISITAYLIEKRIRKAEELLVHSNMSISAIAMHVGYSNFSYFTKIFKENTGYSPKKYREVKSQSSSIQK